MTESHGKFVLGLLGRNLTNHGELQINWDFGTPNGRGPFVGAIFRNFFFTTFRVGVHTLSLGSLGRYHDTNWGGAWRQELHTTTRYYYRGMVL